jgi:hypothetical protein
MNIRIKEEIGMKNTAFNLLQDLNLWESGWSLYRTRPPIKSIGPLKVDSGPEIDYQFTSKERSECFDRSVHPGAGYSSAGCILLAGRRVH